MLKSYQATVYYLTQLDNPFQVLPSHMNVSRAVIHNVCIKNPLGSTNPSTSILRIRYYNSQQQQNYSYQVSTK